MQTTDPTVVAPVEAAAPHVQWSAAIAGALIAAAVSVVLIAFGAAIGLSVTSTTPTWRDASPALAVASSLYLLLTAVASFGLGGYAAGRLRARWASLAESGIVEFRDGMQGVLTWAIAVVISGLVVAATAAGVASNAVHPSAAPAASASEALVAYDLDRLFRADRRPVEGDLTYNRAEAGRILLAAAGRQGIQPEDRAYLARLVMARTGIAAPDAERRVDNAITSATTAVRKARRSSVILGFAIAVSLLLGAAVAWAAAVAGGRHRDDPAPPVVWRFSGWAKSL